VIQYYQEVGGVNGYYSVVLTIQTDAGNVEITTCDMFFVASGFLRVYPVPAHVLQGITIEISLTAEELDGAVIEIFDAKGALVREQRPVTSTVIKVDGFDVPGSYFGRILTGTNEMKTVKFVIVK